MKIDQEDFLPYQIRLTSIFDFQWARMISKHLIAALTCFFLALIGIERTIYWIFFLLACLLGFFIHLIVHQNRWFKSNPIYDRIQSSFVKSTFELHLDLDYDSSIPSQAFNEREPLTGVSDIDQSLYELIDLFVRDYVEVWYKTQISSDESFIRDVKNGIYMGIRHLAERLREIDWLDFSTGTVVDSFATHIRLYRKAKERMRLEQSTDIRSCFFDLEAEYERGICRDEVCLDKEKEKAFLRDIVEVLIYILLPANEFRCVPVRLILREVMVNLALVPFIDMYSDSDVINQLIIKMCQQIPLTIDNFLLVVKTTDSRIELSMLNERLDVEINRWRSKDTGGENDAEIRATINSYQYLKKLLNDKLEVQSKFEPLIFDEDEMPAKTVYRDLPLNEVLNNPNGLDYFLKFLQSIDSIGYGNFYLNAEAFRYAGISAQQQNVNATVEQQETNWDLLRHMAKGLIEQFFLPTGTYKLSMDENLIKKALANLQSPTIDESLLDEIQGKVFELLSSEKFYGQFKTTPQYLKVLNEIDFTDSLTDNSDATSVSSNNSNDIPNDLVESPSYQSSPGANSVSSASIISDTIDSLENYLVTTEIIESGVCSEKGAKYAIYVISVSCKPLNPMSGDQRREWITYRRYSEFNDLHMTIRKQCPNLRDFIHLPNKNFINNTSSEVRLKRQKELNDYLVTLTAPKVLQNNPQLNHLLWKFLRNQQWTHEQSEIARTNLFSATVGESL